MKIYTRTGDKGETGLFGGTRVSKSHARVEAYGDVDELNCAIGVARAALTHGHAGLDAALARVQDECFVVGAMLATPEGKLKGMTLPKGAIKRLEDEIDEWDRDLEPLKQFILPGGAAAGSHLHLARAVCRRAERRAVALSAQDTVPKDVIVYLNRLSDWLFTTARWSNLRSNRAETKWAGLRK
ncbi:MAG: cob(I)yrinic acid a,c-diamide adenosyltransferase [Elusimicrobia bacterium]|nr:cob(I)yrinic acid a,c-diamide adenosyltransferase [Elusimicrobiota bacterium]